MSNARQWVVPHAVEFDPQLREAFLTMESYFAELDGRIGRAAGIYWWDGNGSPNSLSISYARGGDFFIDRITGDVYRFVSEPYTRSEPGAEDESRAYDPGSMWWDDDVDPTVTTVPYRVQDYWLNTASCDVWALR
jgi:hypothetical protein